MANAGKRMRRRKRKAAQKASFGSVLGDDFRQVAKRVLVKRGVDAPRLRKKNPQRGGDGVK